MANNLQSNPWVIDTAAATTIKAGNTFVIDITFSGYSTAGHQCIIKDIKRGIVLYTLTGQTGLPHQSLTFSQPVQVRDIAVTTLTSGICTISVE